MSDGPRPGRPARRRVPGRHGGLPGRGRRLRRRANERRFGFAVTGGHTPWAMFAHSGLSITLGNADPQLRRAASRTPDSNDHDGVAKAVTRLILPQAGPDSHRPENDKETS